MTPAARLAATIEILKEIDETTRPADAIVSHYFRTRRYIGSKDRGAISEQLYALLRHYGRTGWWLAYKGADAAPRLRVIAYLKLVEKASPSDITALFSGGRYAPEALSETETGFLHKLKGHTLFHPEMPENIACECPDWAAASLQKRFGKEFRREMESLLTPAPLDLRVNPLKISRDEALKTLEEMGLKVETTPYSPYGLRVRNRPALGQIKLLKNGALEIQDEGSQLVALLVAPKAGERVVDFCAGAGGKTLALSALMENKGRIVACDVLEGRLKRSGERFRRAGLHNIETRVLSSERDPWVKRHKDSFDRVLVDAPCSGTGTWRRNPDSRWRTLGPGLDNLLALQASILESASRLVKSGGRLVYATCSLLPEENDDQIRRFLDNHPDFALLPVKDSSAHAQSLPDTGKTLSLTPYLHKTDGFFGAIMEKKT